MRGACVAVGAALSLVTSLPSAGQSIIRRSTGLAHPTQTITFSEVALPNNTPVFDQWASFGVFVSGSLFYGGGSAATPGRFPTAAVYNYASSPFLCCTGTFAWFFTSAMRGVAVNFLSQPTSTVFQAYLGGQLVAQFSTATDLTPDLWYGFENTPLDELQIVVDGGTNIQAGLDNVQVESAATVVPEPATLGLFGTGLLLTGLVALRRRRRAALPIA